VKLLADLNVSRHVVAELKARSFSVVRLPEVLDPRASDTEILSYAATHGFVVVTHDLDFTTLLAVRNLAKPSVVTIRLTSVVPAEVAARLVAALEAASADLEAGVALTLSDRSVRLHRLPVG
jgi:predicted nuclease of predicted toxin-antitoxin system